MKPSLCFACPALILILILVGTSAHVRFETSFIEHFVDTIIHLRKYYSVATVIFAHPGDEYGDYGDLHITHLVHTCSRILSRHYIVTLDIHFRRMHRSLRYHHQIVQPLAVVILPDSNGYAEFAEATKNFSMSFPVWLVLFLYAPANGSHDYCRHPLGNPFNLAFNTQMLVICHGDNVMREWYSIKGNTTKVSDLARGSISTGFVFQTSLSLYDRRNNMEGTVLRAVTLKDVPIMSSRYNGNYVANLYGKVLEELTHSLNFTLRFVSEMNEYGILDRQNGTWSGAMGEVVSGRADFIVGDMSMTSLRIPYVDFTQPLIISRNSLFIKEPSTCGVKWHGYFQTFSLQTWGAIVTLIAVMPLLLYLMKACRESQDIADLISDNFISIWGIFCQQALTEFPQCSSLRVAYFTIFCTAILVTASYSAALICFLTACIRILPFRTIDEFVEDGTYKMIVERGSAEYDIFIDSNKSFAKKLLRLMKQESELPNSSIDGFVQVCNEKKLAYLTLNALKRSVEMKIPCKLSSVNAEKIDNLAMVLSKDNPYTDVINFHLQKFQDNGMMMRLRNMKFMTDAVDSKAYEPVRMLSVVPILAILCGGIILSVVILIMEKIHYRFKTQREKRRERRSKAFYCTRKHPFIAKRRSGCSRLAT